MHQRTKLLSINCFSILLLLAPVGYSWAAELVECGGVSVSEIKETASTMVSQSIKYTKADFIDSRILDDEMFENYCVQGNQADSELAAFICLAYDSAHLINTNSKILCESDTPSLKGKCLAESVRKVSSKAIGELKGRLAGEISPSRRISLSASRRCLGGLTNQIKKIVDLPSATDPDLSVKLALKLSQITTIEIGNALSILSSEKIKKGVDERLERIFKARANDYRCASWRLTNDEGRLAGDEKYREQCQAKHEVIKHISAPGDLNAKLSEREAGQGRKEDLVSKIMAIDNANDRLNEACLKKEITIAKFKAGNDKDWRALIDKDVCESLRVAGFTNEKPTYYKDWSFFDELSKSESKKLTTPKAESIIQYMFDEPQKNRRIKAFERAKKIANFAKINYQKELCNLKLTLKNQELITDENFDTSMLEDGLMKYSRVMSDINCAGVQ